MGRVLEAISFPLHHSQPIPVLGIVSPSDACSAARSGLRISPWHGKAGTWRLPQCVCRIWLWRVPAMHAIKNPTYMSARTANNFPTEVATTPLPSSCYSHRGVLVGRTYGQSTRAARPPFPSNYTLPSAEDPSWPIQPHFTISADGRFGRRLS